MEKQIFFIVCTKKNSALLPCFPFLFSFKVYATRPHVIDLADVVKITWQEYKNKRGTIHFMTADYPGFNTCDFQIGRRRDYPTFEMVDDAVVLAEKLEALRQERWRQRSASLPQ